MEQRRLDMLKIVAVAMGRQLHDKGILDVVVVGNKGARGNDV